MEPQKRPKAPPRTVNQLSKLITNASKSQDVAPKRLNRWIGYMVLSGMLDRVRGPQGDRLFLVKGGVAMELHLDLTARATADLDTAFAAGAADIDLRLDEAFSEGYSGFTARRSQPEHVRDTGMQRYQVKLAYVNKPFITIQLEVAQAPPSMTSDVDLVHAKQLEWSGLELPDSVACLPVRWIIAQKLHATTEVVAGRTNDRFRDLLDLQLLEGLVADDAWTEVRHACVELFDERAAHTWPPAVTVFEGWVDGYSKLAAAVGFDVTEIGVAVARIEALIRRIDDP